MLNPMIQNVTLVHIFLHIFDGLKIYSGLATYRKKIKTFIFTFESEITFKALTRFYDAFIISAGTVVGMNAKGARLQHWLDVIKNPGQTHTRVHILSANFID